MYKTKKERLAFVFCKNINNNIDIIYQWAIFNVLYKYSKDKVFCNMAILENTKMINEVIKSIERIDINFKWNLPINTIYSKKN